MKPLVSVIIPVYNGESHLREAVASVLKSTYKNFEVILINDGSTDNSKELCSLLAKKYPQVQTFSFSQNKGLSEALNFAISKAKGVYIARLNQDDLMISDRLEKQVAFLEKNKEYVAVGGAIEWFDEEKQEFSSCHSGEEQRDNSRIPFRFWTSQNDRDCETRKRVIDVISFPTTDADIKKQWLYLSPFSDPASMYRKNECIKTGGYQKQFWPVDDVHMWYMLGKQGKLANLPQVVTKVRWHKQAGSIKSHKIQTKRLFQLHLWAAKYVEKPTLPIVVFWYAQYIAGQILPPQLNWFIYRILKKIRNSRTD